LIGIRERINTTEVKKKNYWKLKFAECQESNYFFKNKRKTAEINENKYKREITPGINEVLGKLLKGQFGQ